VVVVTLEEAGVDEEVASVEEEGEGETLVVMIKEDLMVVTEGAMEEVVILLVTKDLHLVITTLAIMTCRWEEVQWTL